MNTGSGFVFQVRISDFDRVQLSEPSGEVQLLLGEAVDRRKEITIELHFNIPNSFTCVRSSSSFPSTNTTDYNPVVFLSGLSRSTETRTFLSFSFDNYHFLNPFYPQISVSRAVSAKYELESSDYLLALFDYYQCRFNRLFEGLCSDSRFIFLPLRFRCEIS